MVLEQLPEFFGYINAQLGANYWPCDGCRVFGKFAPDGQVMAVLCLHTIVWGEGRADVSIATDGTKRWFTKGDFANWLDIVFGEMGLNRLQTYTPVHNEAALQLVRRFGLTPEARLADWYGPGQDAILSYVLKRQLLGGG